MSEFHINLEDNVSGAQQALVEQKISEIIETFPGLVTHEVTTFLGDRIAESISGEKAAVVVNLFGDNLDDLDSAARDVADTLAKVPGAGEVQVKSPPKGPRLVVRPRPEQLIQLGYKPMEVLEAVQVAFEGEVVGQSYEGTEVTDVVVISAPAARSSPEQVQDLIVQNAAGTRMPLRQLADVYQDVGRADILHEAAQRRQTVTCDPTGVDTSTFVAAARKQVDKLELPDAVHADWAGEAQAEAAARNQLLLHSAIAGVGILILLAIVFGNLRNLVLLLVNLPFAVVGGVLAIILTSHDHSFPGWALLRANPADALTHLKLGTLSIGAMVGFVTLFGITTRNSIMLLSHFEHLVRVEGMTWGKETAVRGASERLVPILMTALVTGMGLLPLAMGTGEAGREIEGPMAVVILGGLATSTLLNLLVMPTLALRFGRFRTTAAAEQ